MSIDDPEGRLRGELARAAGMSALGQLLEAIAHEVNQPLMSISANAGAALRRLGREPSGTARVEALLREILAQSQRAGQLIQTLQTLAQHRPQFGRVAVHALARETPLRARAALERHGARLELDLAAPRDAVDGDPVHLRQLLLELLRHALQAIGPADGLGEGAGTRAGAGAAGVLRLATAAGAAGTLEVRVDYPDEGGADRAGMALAICRAIAEGHGGRLEIRPRPMHGCSIIVTLPELQGGSA
jgi:signal transduction histidine kinase